MRKLLALFVLTLPLIATAGPEDRAAGAVYQATSSVPDYLSTFSFDTVHMSADKSKMILEAGNGTLTGEFQVVNAVRINEEQVQFTAEKVILNKWESGCGEGEFAKATIQGTSDASSGMSATNLTFSVVYTLTLDTCHSRPQTQLINYELVR